MTRKTSHLYIALVVLNSLLFAGLIFIFINNQQQTSTAPPISTREITLTQVQQHAATDSCWTIVGTKVYDITPYIANHPDDTVFIKSCGMDATDSLLPSSTPEQNVKTNKLLEAYFIGILVP